MPTCRPLILRGCRVSLITQSINPASENGTALWQERGEQLPKDTCRANFMPRTVLLCLIFTQMTSIGEVHFELGRVTEKVTNDQLHRTKGLVTAGQFFHSFTCMAFVGSCPSLSAAAFLSACICPLHAAARNHCIERGTWKRTIKSLRVLD